MEPLSKEEVEDFLEKNPTFFRVWLYRHKNESLTKNIILKWNEQTIQNPFFSLCFKVLQTICKSLNSRRASLFMIHGNETKRYLVSKLIDVTPTSIMEQTLHTEENAIRIPYGKGILGYVAEHNCLVTSEDPYNDPRFTNEIDIKMDRYTRNMITTPVTNVFGIVVGVTQVINKKDGKPFTEVDENIARSFSSICGISLDNEQFFEMTREEFQRHQLILKVAKCILKEQVNLKKLISEILRQAREMLHCSKIIVYLTGQSTDPATPTTSSDVYQLLQDENEVNIVPLPSTYIGPIDDNLKGNRTINTVNLQLTSAEMLVAVEEDVSNWLVCMSMTNYRSKVVGCILFARNSEYIFSQSDINTMEIFAKLCGVGIYNCQLHERSVRILQQKEVMNEVLAFYTTCDQNSLDKILKLRILSAKEYGIHSFDFDDSNFSENETVLICVRIFLEKNALSILNVPIDVLYRFILTIKKNYYKHICHNWRHAVKTMQSMFSILTTGNMQLYFTEFQQICLITAAVLLDLDYKHTPNTFQGNTLSPFVKLYSNSFLEHHCVNRFFMILKNKSTDIFSNLLAQIYQYGLQFIEKAILSTDIQRFGRYKLIFTDILEYSDRKFDDPEHVEVLVSILMKAADISSITKPWSIQKSVAVKVVAEFCQQRGVEKTDEAFYIMNGEKRYTFPEIQVEFIDKFCYTLYQSLCELQNHLRPLFRRMLNNRFHWNCIANGLEQFNFEAEIENVYSENKFLNQIKMTPDEKKYSPVKTSSGHNKILNRSISTQTEQISPKMEEGRRKYEQSCQTDHLRSEFRNDPLKNSLLHRRSGSWSKNIVTLVFEFYKQKDTRSTQTMLSHFYKNSHIVKNALLLPKFKREKKNDVLKQTKHTDSFKISGGHEKSELPTLSEIGPSKQLMKSGSLNRTSKSASNASKSTVISAGSISNVRQCSSEHSPPESGTLKPNVRQSTRQHSPPESGTLKPNVRQSTRQHSPPESGTLKGKEPVTASAMRKFNLWRKRRYLQKNNCYKANTTGKDVKHPLCMLF